MFEKMKEETNLFEEEFIHQKRKLSSRVSLLCNSCHKVPSTCILVKLIMRAKVVTGYVYEFLLPIFVIALLEETHVEVKYCNISREEQCHFLLCFGYFFSLFHVQSFCYKI